jgi:hypothetical protein
VLLELVGVLEDDLGERSTTAGVVDDVLHDAANVSLALGIVEGAELGRGLVEAGVGREDGATALSLVADLEKRDLCQPVLRSSCSISPVSHNVVVVGAIRLRGLGESEMSRRPSIPETRTRRRRQTKYKCCR